MKFWDNTNCIRYFKFQYPMFRNNHIMKITGNHIDCLLFKVTHLKFYSNSISHKGYYTFLYIYFVSIWFNFCSTVQLVRSVQIDVINLLSTTCYQILSYYILYAFVYSQINKHNLNCPFYILLSSDNFFFIWSINGRIRRYALLLNSNS